MLAPLYFRVTGTAGTFHVLTRTGSHLGLKIDSYVGNESRMSNAGVPTMSLEAF